MADGTTHPISSALGRGRLHISARKRCDWRRTPRRLGGPRVASYLPNRVETVVAFLACASIGAIWSSCAPDMGANVVLDRLRQIEPKLLLATDSTTYNGKTQDRAAVVGELLRGLPSVNLAARCAGLKPSRATPEKTPCVRWRCCRRKASSRSSW